MNIFDVFTREELDELPDDHREAFVAFAQRAERVLEERISNARQSSEEDSWRYVEDERQGFMNIVVAAAKRFGIEEFVNREVPSPNSSNHSDYLDFKSDLDHYLTQIYLDNSIRSKRDAVSIQPKSKERIRTYISKLRNCIDKADLSDGKRQALHQRLTVFEAELEKSRLSLLAVTRVTLEVMALAGGAWQTGEIAHKLISNVMHEVAEAKAADDETRQLSRNSAPAMLSPPRSSEFRGPRRLAPAFEPGVDEDIPF